MKAVIYARYSSSGQRDESIEGQIRDCRHFAEQNGMTVVGEYTDRALTGRTDKRPDFQRMIKDSAKGIFDAVLCWKIDRFARDRYDSATYKQKLKKNGVKIFYAKEAIPDDSIGIVLESMLEGYAEYYSVNLSENVKRGNYDSALECKTLGHAVYGYRTDENGRYAIDPATAPIVKRIFAEYASGERAKNVFQRLNAEGHRTIRGNLFNKSGISQMLQNRKYIGEYKYKDMIVENGVPAIIDKELFERVQRMLRVNGTSPAHDKNVFLLTTKLFCGLCGEHMVGDSGTNHVGKVYSYYTCIHRKRDNACKKKSVRKQWIEDRIINDLHDLIMSDDFVNDVAEKAESYANKLRDTSTLDALNAKLKEHEKSIKNIISAIEKGIISDTMTSRLTELESEKADIENGIAKESIKNLSITKEQVLFFLMGFRSEDINDPDYREHLIDTFLNCVYLYDDTYVLVINYSGEHTKITKKIIDDALSSSGTVSSDFDLSGRPKHFSRASFILKANQMNSMM